MMCFISLNLTSTAWLHNGRVRDEGTDRLCFNERSVGPSRLTTQPASHAHSCSREPGACVKNPNGLLTALCKGSRAGIWTHLQYISMSRKTCSQDGYVYGGERDAGVYLEREQEGKETAAFRGSQEGWAEGSSQKQTLQVPNGVIVKVQKGQGRAH